MATPIKGRAKKPSPTLLAGALSVLTAMAKVQTLRPRLEALQAQLLAETPYYPTAENIAHGERNEPLSWADLYLCEPAYWPVQQARYYELFTAAGFTVSDPDCCPLLIAETELRDAERDFVKLSGELSDFPVELVELWTDAGKKYLKLTLSYVGQFLPKMTRAEIDAQARTVSI